MFQALGLQLSCKECSWANQTQSEVPLKIKDAVIQILHFLLYLWINEASVHGLVYMLGPLGHETSPLNMLYEHTTLISIDL